MRKLILSVVVAAMPAIAVAAPVTYDGSQSTNQYNVPTTGGIGWTGVQYINPTKVIYDSATNSYTVRDTGKPALTSTFTGGTVGADYTTYSKMNGSVTETLKVLNKANTLLPLTYVQYGKWRRSGQPLNFNNNDTYIVFGTKTARSAMPVAGTGNYVTILDGTYINKNGVYAVSGNGTLTATFAAGTIDYSATATGTRETGGSTINFGTLAGTGFISNGGPAFKGTTLGANAQGYSMNIWGNFYGPAADEVGGNFSIKGDRTTLAPGVGNGAFVGN
ncbi:MAG: hypothetical protein ABIO29_06120 [Sphingomicrobium sp.]